MTPTVRPLTSDDFPWMRRLFVLRYPNTFDAETTENWMRELVLRGPMTFHAVRNDGALCVSLITAFPWLPNERQVNVIVVLADIGRVWDTLPVLRASIAWARSRQASTWRFQSDFDLDFSPLMRRLGVPLAGPRFRLDL